MAVWMKINTIVFFFVILQASTMAVGDDNEDEDALKNQNENRDYEDIFGIIIPYIWNYNVICLVL